MSRNAATRIAGHGGSPSQSFLLGSTCVDLIRGCPRSHSAVRQATGCFSGASLPRRPRPMWDLPGLLDRVSCHPFSVVSRHTVRQPSDNELGGN